MSLPRIRKDFRRIARTTARAILFADFDGKEYWVPSSLCTLIKEKKDRVIATLAVSKFEEIANVKVEPLTTVFASLGGNVLPQHATSCELTESRTTPLLPPQKTRVERLLQSKHGALLCDAGTGKTLMTLTVAYSRYKAGIIRSVFVLCPASLQQQWKEMVTAYFQDFEKAVTVKSIHAASYASNAEQLIAECKLLEQPVQLIVDEVHLCRNQSAHRSRNIERLFNPDYCMIATAFPIERNAGDLFYQFGIMDRTIIGCENYSQFQKSFLLLGGDDGETVVAYQNTSELAKRINPYIVRLTKEEVMVNMPKKVYHECDITLSHNQRAALSAISGLESQYKFLPDRKRYQLSTFNQKIASGYVPSDEEVRSIFGDLGMLGESANNVSRIAGIGYDADNARIKELQRIVEQVGDEQAIIWCNYIDEMKTIHSILPGSEIINGSTNLTGRSNCISRFRSGKVKYLIISIAINEGFNLQCCTNAIFFSKNYSRTKNLNAEDRIYRIGQTKTCHIWAINAIGSVDERISRTLKRKNKICKTFDGYED